MNESRRSIVAVVPIAVVVRMARLFDSLCVCVAIRVFVSTFATESITTHIEREEIYRFPTLLFTSYRVQNILTKLRITEPQDVILLFGGRGV